MDTQTSLANAKTVRLADYQPPAWRVTHVELKFELGIDETRVHSKLTLARDRDEPLRLDGEDFELVGVRLDGRALAADEYQLDPSGLLIASAHDGSVLELDVRIDPTRNSQLSGLYLSGAREHGFLLTQCEAQGFRRITFFPDRPDVLARYDVTLVADKARFPVLLAGGEEVESGDLEDGRHFARFVDPHPKPSYLFALVAGRLEKIERAYRTADGRDVMLRLWAEADAIGRCHYAMDALERAMRWDEQAYGRNYDLPVFNVVATHDFNMGAMENKGLNIFNSKYLLADPDTTTDDEYRHIEAVVGHEYFHNWSGNRVTCRDWFQLSLKEGFTVFREHSFCEATHSPALKRIEDVATLRRVQFPEDAGPLAHPVRPAAYQAIDNFYTATVYEKGAELIRMIAGRLGGLGFRRGTDLYFSRFDGQAVTIDDLLTVLGEANGLDLSPYLVWYTQAGTPELRVRDDYDAAAKRYTLILAQRTPPTPGQPHKQPVPIPVNLALFADDGTRVPLQRADDTTAPLDERVLELTVTEQRFIFEDLPAKPTPSLCRGFSAPVQVHFDYTPAQLALLLQHETSGFDRWNAAQQLAARAFDEALTQTHPRAATDAWLDALARLFAARVDIDPALLADLLTPPSALELGARHSPFDPDRVHAAREALEHALAQRLGDALAPAYRELHANESGALDQHAAAHRRLKARVLALLPRRDAATGAALAFAQCRDARGMTDRLAALSALVRSGAPQAAGALRSYRERFECDALTLDKWFMLQATVPAHATLERVQALETDPAFTLANPNRVQALLGAFARGNPVAFHRPDGAGHRWFAGKLAEIDARNPQLSARLAKAFEDWKRLEPKRRASAEAALCALLARGRHSPDLREILARMLGADDSA
ncbi:MAG: Membrane alanine aminopeptidase N [Rhodanobacteraceae bacterium]|jgi:aminopeptidase N|nr:MAG: Membrane alanine aminopeptidase N [Rhodanobacteraceae bacterium]